MFGTELGQDGFDPFSSDIYGNFGDPSSSDPSIWDSFSANDPYGAFSGSPLNMPGSSGFNIGSFFQSLPGLIGGVRSAISGPVLPLAPGTVPPAYGSGYNPYYTNPYATSGIGAWIQANPMLAIGGGLLLIVAVSSIGKK